MITEHENAVPSPSSATAAEQPSFLSCSASMESNTGNAGDKKQVWKKPDNGIVETGPVMSYAVSWPALSESTRLPPKSTLESSASVTGPVIANSPQNKELVDNKSNPTMPVRHRLSKRGGGGGAGLVQNVCRFPPPQQPLLPRYPLPYGPFVGAATAFSLEGHNNWEGRPIGGFGSQSQSLNDFSLQRNPSRRDSGRGQIAPPRGFLPPSRPPVSNPFIRPHSVMPFEMTYPFPYGPTRPWESFGGQPFNAQVPPPMSFPIQDDTLPNSLVNQIEYYFSDANLIKDEFLRSKMDHEGWVPIDLIAGFPRVQGLTKNIELILNSVRASSIVEIKECNKQCNKLRRRNDWRRWICRSGRFPTDSSSLGLANGECVNEGASSSQL
ncbi:La-related protein like [Actinidia chinensis var. chinensis]|uniref:La-related protein like n=1 Tax=Actinidia chinensis var. chinensis TaxID=1590841 RepID=A0A2R6RMH4_ACTCC|nr:La-related protein like [Actinidia chinensis var. chinensis]